MDWMEIFVETSKAGLEVVSGVLYSAGITGLSLTDADEYAEFLQNKNRTWDYTEDGLDKGWQGYGITFYLRDNPAGHEDFSLIKEGLSALKKDMSAFDLGSLEITVKNVKDSDWENNWKKYFKPFEVGKSLVIKPTWENYENSGNKKILEIDPGNVFGSGSHESTKMCLEALEEQVKGGEKILDIGCGSGILSVGGLIFGGGYADLVDIDKNAGPAVSENMRINGISPEKYVFYAGDILTDNSFDEMFSGKDYDIVCANIVADVVIALSERVGNYLKKGGIFISSGIIAEREEDVRESLEKNGFSVSEVRKMGNWRAFVAINP